MTSFLFLFSGIFQPDIVYNIVKKRTAVKCAVRFLYFLYSLALQRFPKSRLNGIDKELQRFFLVLSLTEQLNFVSAFDTCAKDA